MLEQSVLPSVQSFHLRKNHDPRHSLSSTKLVKTPIRYDPLASASVWRGEEDHLYFFSFKKPWVPNTVHYIRCGTYDVHEESYVTQTLMMGCLGLEIVEKSLVNSEVKNG